MKTLSLMLIFVAIYAYPLHVLGHDTTHIHPLISAKISDLIKQEDSLDAYGEIYELEPQQDKNIDAPQRLYWGTDFDPTAIKNWPSGEKDYLSDDRTDPWLTLLGAPKKKTTITGVIYEDVPFLKVLNHFYQAESGQPLFANENSANTAMAYFNQAIEAMGGYSEDSKQESFFLFGQALHHVEDMSSPAHIHNDPHLTFYEPEKDDFEGWFLPLQKQTTICGDNMQGCAYFNNAAITPITNPWDDIWGSGIGSSLVMKVHSGSSYHANLAFTVSVFDEIADSYEYWTKAVTPPPPQGELAEMFPCTDPGNSDDPCLQWVEDSLDWPAHWQINTVGDFHHQVSNVGPEDSWWPTVYEYDKSVIGQSQTQVVAGSNNGAYGERYYIEQLSHPKKCSALDPSCTPDPLDKKVTPASLRSNLYSPWEGNMAANNMTILERYAQTFLRDAVGYGAGFTRYWYDVANTPPYLKIVTVRQAPAGSATAQQRYKAQWVAEIDRDTAGEDARLIDRKGPTLAMHAQEGMEIELEFNEPIKTIMQLRLGEFNPNGSCVLPANGCVDITPVQVAGIGVILGNADKTWLVTVPQSYLAGLNGKLTLTVKAIDKNNHRGSGVLNEGEALDSDPATPARRDLSSVLDADGNLIANANDYPWYSADGQGGKNDYYSYEYKDGDRNHALIFDSSATTVLISVDTQL